MPMRTVSPPDNWPRKTQESGRFWRAAVHFGLTLAARNLSLAPGFLFGCSLRPFGTHPEISAKIRSLGRLASVRDFELSLGRPRSPIKPRRELCCEAMAKDSVVWTRTAPRGIKRENHATTEGPCPRGERAGLTNGPAHTVPPGRTGMRIRQSESGRCRWPCPPAWGNQPERIASSGGGRG